MYIPPPLTSTPHSRIEHRRVQVRSEELVTEAIGRLRLGRTCVMITHRISTARDADFVVGQRMFAARVRVARLHMLRSYERRHRC
jgi:ABC-type transport system involved in cytochrome bd biosynthesis fused ATPase/permease subunit